MKKLTFFQRTSPRKPSRRCCIYKLHTDYYWPSACARLTYLSMSRDFCLHVRFPMCRHYLNKNRKQNNNRRLSKHTWWLKHEGDSVCVVTGFNRNSIIVTSTPHYLWHAVDMNTHHTNILLTSTVQKVAFNYIHIMHYTIALFMCGI